LRYLAIDFCNEFTGTLPALCGTLGTLALRAIALLGEDEAANGIGNTETFGDG
jgi:hypothetical protein